MKNAITILFILSLLIASLTISCGNSSNDYNLNDYTWKTEVRRDTTIKDLYYFDEQLVNLIWFNLEKLDSIKMNIADYQGIIYIKAYPIQTDIQLKEFDYIDVNIKDKSGKEIKKMTIINNKYYNDIPIWRFADTCALVISKYIKTGIR